MQYLNLVVEFRGNADNLEQIKSLEQVLNQWKPSPAQANVSASHPILNPRVY